MAITAKYVRTLAPGGAALNFVGITGNSHRYFPVSTTLIEKALRRGVKVYELVETLDAENNVTATSEIELTLENFESDNGGKAVAEGVNIVPDIEKETADKHAEEFAAILTEKGLAIQQRQTTLSQEYLSTIDTITGGSTGADSVPSGTGADSISGGSTGADSVPSGTGADSISGGSTGADSVPSGTGD